MKTVIYETCYCKENDLTFVMKYEYRENSKDVIGMECIAFYCGQPDPDATNYYINHPSVRWDY